MISFKQITAPLSFTMALSILPVQMVQAKQKLDQPALLPSDALKPVADIHHYMPNYMAVSDDGRIFVQLLQTTPEHPWSLAIVNKDNSLTPYPDPQWNNWVADKSNPKSHFVNLDGMTMTPDQKLWIVDNGIDKNTNKPVPDGAKILVIDTKTNKITATYPIPNNVLKADSIINAIAVHNDHVYLADRGSPAIIVFNIKQNLARRVLQDSPSLYSRKAIIVNHKIIKPNSDHEDSRYNVNQLAISPDGKKIYYQAASGPLYRMDAMYLNDPTYTPAELNEAMMIWVETPSSGGIICDDDGTLYFDDIATNSIYRFTTGRILNKLITDPRLQWPAHPFVTKDKTLYIPITQQDKSKLLNKDPKATIEWPLHLYKLTVPSLK